VWEEKKMKSYKVGQRQEIGNTAAMMSHLAAMEQPRTDLSRTCGLWVHLLES
jgi:hypothetical protein